MIRTFERLTEVVFCCISESAFLVPVHWLGRNVVCAGGDCPVCPSRTPRRSFFAGILVENERRICELNESLFRGVRTAATELGQEKLTGVCVRAVRSHKRDAWRVEQRKVAAVNCELIGEAEIVFGVACLYRLSLPFQGEDWYSWLERVRVDQVDLLRAGMLVERERRYAREADYE